MNLDLLRFGVCCAFLAACGPVLVNCGGQDQTSEKARTALTPPDQVYTVRGRIVDLPSLERPASNLLVLHEAIDDFVDRHGAVVGMNAMTMPFTPARDLPLEEFQIDDYVELVFEVRWNAPPLSHVISMRKLPDDTELVLRRAQPPG